MERTQASVQEGYERWATTYDRDPNPLISVEERQLKLMLPDPRGKRVLDLACGTGRWLEWVISAGAAFAAGVDFSAGMLAKAREKPGIKGRLSQADCNALPFPDSVFDLVVFSFAAAHIANLKSVALEVKRVAAPMADIFVSDVHPLAHAQGWRTGFHDDLGPVEISTWPRSTDQFVAPWTSAGLQFTETVECRFGELERQILIRAGKGDRFLDYCSIPAVFICHFTQGSLAEGTD